MNKKLGSNTRYTIEEVIQIFKNRNCILLSEDYKNNSQKLTVKCPKEHIFHPSLRDFIYKESGCSTCSKNKRYTFEEIASILKEEDYTLISKFKTKDGTRIKVLCKNNHEWEVSWGNFNSTGRCRCPKCQNIVVYDIQKVKEIFKKENYTLKSIFYKNCMTPLETVCPSGHEYSVRLNDFLNKNSRCTRCRLFINENKCREVFEKLFKVSFLKSRPKFLLKIETNRLLELDGFNDDLKLAFEYDGEQHFNPVYGTDHLLKMQKNDALKDDLCKKNNVILIRIPYTIDNKEKFIKEELDKRGIIWHNL